MNLKYLKHFRVAAGAALRFKSSDRCFDERREIPAFHTSKVTILYFSLRKLEAASGARQGGFLGELTFRRERRRISFVGLAQNEKSPVNIYSCLTEQRRNPPCKSRSAQRFPLKPHVRLALAALTVKEPPDQPYGRTQAVWLEFFSTTVKKQKHMFVR